nr:hypothetical protein [Flexithrix dorotheae]
MLKQIPDLETEWEILVRKIKLAFGKSTNPDLNSVLFLIGVQELGKGPDNFSKEEKQNLIHIAICKVLSLSGYYTLDGVDKDGWPHWVLQKKLPFFDLLSQEKLLKMHIIEYFKTEIKL